MYTSYADHSNTIELIATSKSKSLSAPNVIKAPKAAYAYVRHTCLSFYPAKHSSPVSIVSFQDLSPIFHHIHLLSHEIPEYPQGLQDSADLLHKGFCKASVRNNR